MRVIVCGGRGYNRGNLVFAVLDSIHAIRSITTIVHGQCPSGVDQCASNWAWRKKVLAEPYPADWDTHGRAAGPIRNSAMAALGADLCIAFPGGKGTADMAAKAAKHRIPVLNLGAKDRCLTLNTKEP